MDDEAKTCCHCQRPITVVGARNVRRGLCRPCYLQKSIRRQYKTSTYREKRKRLPDHPTDAVPGSPEKIRVMADRVAAGRQIFHPADTVQWTRDGWADDW